MPQILWEQIYIDFVTELPEDDGYRTIMICIDHFSKMVELVLLQDLDAQTVTSRFLAKVVIHCGLPASIINSRYPRF